MLVGLCDPNTTCVNRKMATLAFNIERLSFY
jgi:hypothetical protein